VLGPELNGADATQLTNFKNYTGATFPLLLNGGSGSGNENLYVPYGQFDNYVVINKQGIIRYHAFDLWQHGMRYHLNEIRATVDSLVSTNVGVDDGPGARAYLLNPVPNPFRDATTLELWNPSGQPRDAEVSIHDLAGRRIASVWSGPAPAGWTRVAWGGRSGDGSAVATGVYLVRARVGAVRLDRRVVRIR
jgi:hypothetical protein